MDSREHALKDHPGARVLFVDRDARVGKDWGEILKRHGIPLVAVACGNGSALVEDARELTGTIRPHVIVMDLRLLEGGIDDRTGLDLLGEEPFVLSFGILHSAFLTPRITYDAVYKVSHRDVVAKPEAPERLIEAIMRVLKESCAKYNDLIIHWPSAWNAEVIASVVAGQSDLPSHLVDDLLVRLFRTEKSITLKTIGGAAESPRESLAKRSAVVMEAWREQQSPLVVKIASRTRIEKELRAYYKHVQHYLGGNYYAQLHKCETWWELGGISYSFLGGDLTQMRTLSSFYRDMKEGQDIGVPIQRFFDVAWRRHYENKRAINSTLVKAYDNYLMVVERAGALVKRGVLSDSEFSEEWWVLPTVGKITNPIQWIARHERDSRWPWCKECVTHGDLHADNMLIDGPNAWVIDYERCGYGHSMRDFVELEQDILTRLMSVDDNEYALIVTSVVAAAQCSEGIEMGRRDMSHEGRKAIEVLKIIRASAANVAGCRDMREYYWGLLMEAVMGGLLSERESQRCVRNMYLAHRLCERLEHWPHLG